MLHPHSEGKGFGMQHPSLAVKELVDIACRVACSQDDGVAFYGLSFGSTDAADMTVVVCQQVVHVASEEVLPSVVKDGVTYIGNDRAEHVGADMGVGIDEYGWVGTVGHQYAQHLADIAPLGGTGIQFTIAESACATFAETPVAVGIENTFASQESYVTFAFLHRFSTFHNHRADTVLQRTQCSKETCWAGTDNDYLPLSCGAVGIVDVEGGRNEGLSGIIYIK